MELFDKRQRSSSGHPMDPCQELSNIGAMVRSREEEDGYDSLSDVLEGIHASGESIRAFDDEPAHAVPDKDERW